VDNLLGTDAPSITSSVGPERDAAPATIAQVIRHANRLAEGGAYREALAVLDPKIEMHCDDAEFHTTRGWALENLGPARMPEARREYETAIALDPSQLWAHAGLANVLAHFGEAAESARIHQYLITQAAGRAEQQPDLLELIGWCQFRLERLDEAVESFRRALSLDKTWVSVRFDLGLALLVGGDEDKATREYQTGLAHLGLREPGQRLGPLLVATDDLEEALRRIPSVQRSPVADHIRAQLRRAANELGHRHA
jgi:Flp pilus assembly protein TadD